ncbi:MAG: hypothetical protein Q9168_007927 [Polycauliona sp. 1 TL-2023]
MLLQIASIALLTIAPVLAQDQTDLPGITDFPNCASPYSKSATTKPPSSAPQPASSKATSTTLKYSADPSSEL